MAGKVITITNFGIRTRKATKFIDELTALCQKYAEQKKYEVGTEYDYAFKF